MWGLDKLLVGKAKLLLLSDTLYGAFTTAVFLAQNIIPIITANTTTQDKTMAAMAPPLNFWLLLLLKFSIHYYYNWFHQ